jgi:hypothetical protein
MSKVIKSIAEMVSAFGGTAKLADLLDIGMPAVSNWKAADKVPPGWHLRLFLEAKKRGIAIDPALFGRPETLRPRHKGRRGRGRDCRTAA